MIFYTLCGTSWLFNDVSLVHHRISLLSSFALGEPSDGALLRGHGHVKTCAYLIQMGVDVNLRDNKLGETAIFYL